MKETVVNIIFFVIEIQLVRYDHGIVETPIKIVVIMAEENIN